MSERDHVRDAIARWERAGLIDAGTADSLRTESDAYAAGQGRRWAQYAVAATGAVILVIAAAAFLRWAWPLIGEGGQSILLGVCGLGVMLLGMALESRVRVAPAAYLLQAAGLALMLMATVYSGGAWSDATPAAIAFAAAVVAVPLVTAGIAIRRNPVMPAIHTAFGYAFLFVFIERATTLDSETILWILDGVALLAIALLAWRLRDASHHDEDDWTLNAFVASLWAAGVLVFFTALGPLDLNDDSVWALNLWLVSVTALTLWGIHRAPPGLRRAWFGRQLALCVILGIILGFATTLGPLDFSGEAAALSVGGIGAIGLAYGLRFDARDTIAASCLALLCAAWYFGAETGGAIGGVIALVLCAALFFWLSTRLGRSREA